MKKFLFLLIVGLNVLTMKLVANEPLQINESVSDANEISNLRNTLQTGTYVFHVKTSEKEYVQKITL